MVSEGEVKLEISKFLKVTEDQLGNDISLTDLITDSFILIDLAIQLQEKFKVRLVQEDLKDVKKVCQLVAVIRAKSSQGPK